VAFYVAVKVFVNMSHMYVGKLTCMARREVDTYSELDIVAISVFQCFLVCCSVTVWYSCVCDDDLCSEAGNDQDFGDM
jgi:hypothetical protein